MYNIIYINLRAFFCKLQNFEKVQIYFKTIIIFNPVYSSQIKVSVAWE